MTFLCNIVVLSCQLVEIGVKVVLFFLTCNGLLTRFIHRCCQSCCKSWASVLGCSCQSWQGCGLRLTVRSALKVTVRCFHGLLTLAITAALIYYKTGLRAALDNYDVVFCWCFFSTLAVSLTTYYVSCFIDPGYLPIPVRERHNTFDSDEEDDSTTITEMAKIMISKTPPRKCGFCGVLQPLRARHCEDCNLCVRRFDHHCPWLDTCIGEDNHRFFLAFVISKSLLTIWASIIICGALEIHAEWGAWLRANWVLLVSLSVTSVAALILTVLSCLHTYLMAANLTTWEFVSRDRISYLKHLDDQLNPFHQGYLFNMYSFMFSRSHQRWDLIYHNNTPDAETV